MWLGVLDDFSGLTEVTIYPQSMILLQTVVVLAFAIPGLMITGWWDTPLTHKQLKNTKSKLTLDTYGWDNEHFPVCLYSYSSRGTELAGAESLWPSQTKTDLNWTGTELEPEAHVGALL